MSDITVHQISTNLETYCQLCRDVIDRGDVSFELLTDTGLVLACQPCTERLIPDRYDGVLDRPKPPLSSSNRTFQYKTGRSPAPVFGIFAWAW
jgi:hypothetical protein